MGAARNVRTGLTAIGGRNSRRPSALMWLWKSRSLSGSVILLRCSKNIIPSDSSVNRLYLHIDYRHHTLVAHPVGVARRSLLGLE